ncbi:MAG: hypothetical protein JXA24_07595 [Proteobacteria bacterium]|nr:hypothetical protein [Pseudomonadota bacterium]
MEDTRNMFSDEEGVEIGLSAGDLSDASGDAQKRLMELQLKMAASSINHEYARQKFDEISDRTEREDLLAYMDDCHREYNDARTQLAAFDPYALADFEADLMRQKQSTAVHYSA